MSYFGDHTPAQDLLETAINIQQQHKFTDTEMQILLHEVVGFFFTQNFTDINITDQHSKYEEK